MTLDIIGFFCWNTWRRKYMMIQYQLTPRPLVAIESRWRLKLKMRKSGATPLSIPKDENPRELCLNMVSILKTVLITYLLTLDDAISNDSKHHVSIIAKMLSEKCWLAYSQDYFLKSFEIWISKNRIFYAWIFSAWNFRSWNFQKFQNLTF